MVWRVASMDDLKEFYHRLKAKEVPITRVIDYGISLGIYFRDPDRNGIEVYYELPRSEWPQQERIFAAEMVNRGIFRGRSLHRNQHKDPPSRPVISAHHVSMGVCQ
jgi:catechol 2,3-dioxygenase